MVKFETYLKKESLQFFKGLQDVFLALVPGKVVLFDLFDFNKNFTSTTRLLLRLINFVSAMLPFLTILGIFIFYIFRWFRQFL